MQIHEHPWTKTWTSKNLHKILWTYQQTNGFARNYSGVSLESFQKKITFQKLSKEGILGIGPAIEIMAEAEELFAHKNAVTLRLKDLNNV